MPRVVVITGTDRSGTSLAASLLQSAGLDMGDRLIAPGASNPHGYFEDADFVEFHERAFKSRGSANTLDHDFVFDPTEEEKARADQIVASRNDRALWGFKDPRASQFLDFWEERLDGAAYIFLYRHPIDVLLSLLRYGEPRATGLAEPIRSWQTRNTRILEFRARNPGRCAIVHAYGFTDSDRLNDVLHGKLGLDVSVTPDIVAQLYRPGELHPAGRWAEHAFGLIEPATAELYCELTRVADVPPPDHHAADEPENLAAYRRAAAGLLPEVGGHRRGLLLSLVEIVAPDIAERGMTAQLRWILELEEAKEWLEGQRLSWMNTAEALERQRIRNRIGRLIGRFRGDR